MAQTLSTISIISFIAAGVFAVITVILGFAFKITSVIGDLSGRTARKSIEMMRKNNETNNKTNKNKSYMYANSNKARKKTEEKPFMTGKLNMVSAESETLPLQNSGETLPLAGESETALLMSKDGQTLSSDNNITAPLADRQVGVRLVMIEDVVLVNTDEVI